MKERGIFMENREKVKISGKIENVVYRNESNDYTVIEISDENELLITAVGIMPLAFEGENVVLSPLPSIFIIPLTSVAKRTASS